MNIRIFDYEFTTEADIVLLCIDIKNQKSGIRKYDFRNSDLDNISQYPYPS